MESNSIAVVSYFLENAPVQQHLGSHRGNPKKNGKSFSCAPPLSLLQRHKNQREKKYACACDYYAPALFLPAFDRGNGTRVSLGREPRRKDGQELIQEKNQLRFFCCRELAWHSLFGENPLKLLSFTRINSC